MWEKICTAISSFWSECPSIVPTPHGCSLLAVMRSKNPATSSAWLARIPSIPPRPTSMVKIYVVDTTVYEKVWTQYDMDPLDTVRKLKVHIYESEGLPAGRQLLQHEGIELRDEQTLQSYSLEEGCIVKILRNQIWVKLGGLGLPWLVDLDAPLSDLRDTVSERYDLNEDSAAVKFKEQMLAWDDKRTLSSLGMYHYDSVTHIGPYSFKPGSPVPFEHLGIATRQWSDSRSPGSHAHALSHTKALYDWDGDMKHPRITGLPLRKGIIVVTLTDEPGWWHGREDGQNTFGYFPSNYVGDVNATESSDPPPRLPEFSFPRAIPNPAIFILRLGEMGQSYVQVTLNYQNRAPPGEPTLVDVSLVCSATGGRRITSLGIMIRSPSQRVRDLRYPTPRAQQSISVKAIDDRSVENNLGIALNIPHAGLTANASTSREHELTVTESGFRESQMKISGNEHGEHGDIAHWRVDAAEGVGGRREDIPAQMNLSFVLDEKPAVFQYRFFVVSTDAKGNSRTHSGGSLELREGKWKVFDWWARLVTGRKWTAPQDTEARKQARHS
ncbi:Ubiquitin-like domain-containing protein [Mycena sanguinolenta]|uniref:Ubiquitin-like domain-containing protein n=1 Tax=Mycena sanguinolenta TaxID=230812 RepID=A0A8H6Z436_9AGAR|nr:Ubiquitin-like domain-containing protein [Mycena sanguinolenta]